MKAYKNADTVYNAAIKSAKDTLQKAKDNYTNAKARVAAFNKLISGNNVVAQMSGTLSEMSYESGDMLNSMTAIAGYSNENTLSIDVTVDQTDIGKISVGDEASVSVQNMPQTVTGKVAAIETSKYLKVSIRTLQEWRDTGVIPYIQIKGKIIYRQSDIERLLQTYYNKERQE